MKYPDLILFNTAVLRSSLRHRGETLAAAKAGWQGPLGLLAGLGTTLLVSDFQDRFGVAKATWQATIILLTLAAALWTCIAVVKSLKGQGFEVFFDCLYKESLTKESRRIVFLFKALDESGVARILAYKDPVWNCFLLPNTRRSEAFGDESQLENMLLSRFGGVPGSFKITNLDQAELISFKVSQRSKEYTLYSFDFYLVKIAVEQAKRFSERTFRVGDGIPYKWMSIDELAADTQTMAKNGDIVNHLSEHYEETLAATIPWSMDDRVGNA